MIEVLSPVGSPESLEAALRCGCDAVYLGAKSFSARRNAGNFDENELIETVKTCHIHHVKVYVTVNILIKQQELKDALQLVSVLNRIGVDGLIVQDLGLCDLIHRYFPQLPLHGSTQMSIHNKQALPLLKEMGFSRIVIGREMSKVQIADFCREAKKQGIEVEMFVHGALCMSVSGQCLLSAMIGQRSGNRGLCAQPCRLPFKVPNGSGYDLSLKDLSLFQYIDELKELGIASLKIEGRMKRPEYVAMATKCCRDAVDGKQYDVTMLKNIFSRSGFSDGYYQGRLSKENFGIRTKEDVDASLDSFNKIHEFYRNERQCVPLDLAIEIHKDQPIVLRCGDIEIRGECPQIAQKRATTVDEIKENLAKLGGTVYILNDCQIALDDGLFVYNGLINNLRRELVDRLNQKASIIEERTELPVQIEHKDRPHSLTKTYIRIAGVEQLPQETEGIDGVIVPIECTDLNCNKEIIPEIPRYLANEKPIIDYLNQWQKRNIKRVYCNNLAAVALAKSMGFEPFCGNYMNLANSQSLSLFEGCDKTLSAELSLKEIEEAVSLCNKGIIAYGRIPLMLLVNCPLKNGRSCAQCDHHGEIVDRMNVHFPIRCHFGVSELLNSAPIDLADKQDELHGLDFMILYFTIENRQEVESVIERYRNHQKSNSDYTRGLYYRSVL